MGFVSWSSAVSCRHLLCSSVPVCFCQGPAMLLELAGEEAFPLGYLLVPGLQYSLLLHGLQGHGVRVGLVNMGPHSLQAVGVLQLPTHHAHQQLVERIVVHEVAVPPHGNRDRTFLAIIILIVSEQKLRLIFYWCCVM